MAWYKKHRIVIGVVVVGTVLLVGALWFFVFQPQQQAVDAEAEALQSGQDKPYADLTSAERDARSRHETGYTVKELEEKTLDTSVLPTHDKAYAAAQTLASVGKYSKSLEAFRVADVGGQHQDFYRQYVEAAILADEQQLTTDIMKKQLEAVRRESGDKDEVGIHQLEEMIADREAGQ